MKRKKGSIILKILVGAVFVLALFMGVCEAMLDDISGGIVRLHVIANSDSAFDQAVKLKARDALLAESVRLSGEEEIDLTFVQTHRAELTNAVNRILEESGCAYRASIVTGRFSFPTKSYENITLPKGEYDAVRVILGTGSGENWWCVMYPPLCFTESAKGALTEESEEKLSGTMSDAGYALISDETPKLKPAFKAVELWQSFKEKVREKFPRPNKSGKRMVKAG